MQTDRQRKKQIYAGQVYNALCWPDIVIITALLQYYCQQDAYTYKVISIYSSNMFKKRQYVKL